MLISHKATGGIRQTPGYANLFQISIKTFLDELDKFTILPGYRLLLLFAFILPFFILQINISTIDGLEWLPIVFVKRVNDPLIDRVCEKENFISSLFERLQMR
jgi:hypothetical protein